ncbi:hypothetical protein CVT26_011609 [Gymnopilus dilepis]|uniref:Uncharacterized protein n=1 Tax=Gymnopilus dilepis TaxID=231916 RepID=A0A409YQR2_9AGAR|nr:hypothetical protein CVT26_011609 [Gymnopilus dilepis]
MPVQPLSAEQIHASRAEQRKQRLLEIEMEVAAEEAEALKLTEEQRQTLLRPFAAVKAEFTDLDGLRWTQAALCMLSPKSSESQPQRRGPPTTPADVLNAKCMSSSTSFNVLTKADLDNYSPQATVRPSFSASSALVDLGLPSGNRHRDGSHPRSPIKGLFSSRQLDMESKIPSTPSTTDHSLAIAGALQTPSALRFAIDLDEEGDPNIPVPPGLDVTPAPTPFSSPDPAVHVGGRPRISDPSSPTRSLLELTSSAILPPAARQTSSAVPLPSTPSHKSNLSSPRSRLRSLLHDDHAASTPSPSPIRAPTTPELPSMDPGRTPSSTPLAPISRKPNINKLPARSPSRLDFTSMRLYNDDDDETPMPSPITSRRPDIS